jgi:hypothetical protein
MSPTDPNPLPFDLNHDIEWILGRPNFMCASIFRRLRELGHTIREHAEEEQAYTIFWLLQMYVKHGENWRFKVAEYLRG